MIRGHLMKIRIITAVTTLLIFPSFIGLAQSDDPTSQSALALVSAPAMPTPSIPKKLDRNSLVSDARQLADLIESLHPDPYANSGGKVAFHRRLQSLLDSIPAQGMTRPDFYRLLRPFVTAIGDAHTWLRDAYDESSGAPDGIPLYFGVVSTDLYVLAVPEERYRPLIGAVLVSVEGVPYKEIVSRLPTMVSAENEYQLLRNLAYSGFLMNRSFLSDLVPEWRDKSRVRIVLRDKDGHEAEHTIPVPSKLPAKWINPGSRIKRPRPYPEGFMYAFHDSARTTALLIVDDMQSYREMFEEWSVSNPTEAESSAKEVYKRLHQSDAPGDLKAVIAGIPSATECFRTLVQEMRQAGTKTLLVDLRYNQGGNSAMYNVLLYFLYGRDVLLRAKLHRTEIRRFSRYDSPEEFEQVNRGRAIPLTATDYDFSGDWYGRSQRDSSGVDSLKAEFEHELDRMPTFAAEYRSGKHEGYYCPANVMVLSSPQTFSSGYTLMYYLYRAGAKIMGTPSAQAGNCFGEATSFTLQHSQLAGTVSRKQFIYFHDDPEMGRVLRPQYPMTYDKLRSYDFDMNAEILYVLDLVRR